MIICRVAAAVIGVVALGVPAGLAHDAEDHNTTIIYVYPTSPSTFVTVAGLPSFLLMPGAPVPTVATQVVHSVPVPLLPGLPVTVSSTGELDCSQFGGPVFVGANDPHGLDHDDDGIGCEPAER